MRSPKFKHLTSVFLALFLLLSITPAGAENPAEAKSNSGNDSPRSGIQANEVRIAYDAMNPRTKEDNPGGWDNANNAPYPGFRGTDQLLIYTREFGERTGTNDWGYEVTMDGEGTIVSLGGNNSVIPDSGFVVSAHGTKAAQLRTAALGTRALVDHEKKEVVLIQSPETCVREAELLLSEEQERYEKAVKEFQDFDRISVRKNIEKAETLLKKARTALSHGHIGDMEKLIVQSKNVIDQAHFANYESKSAEVRGVWIRPKEKSLAEVKNHIARLRKYRINTIFLETHYNEHSVYPSEIEGQEMNPTFNGFDVLGAYIDVAHREGMSVHAWTKVFMPENGLAKNNPDLAMTQRDGTPYEVTPPAGVAFYWLSPANPRARDLIRRTYAELADNYDLDGYQYDYIRYPDNRYNDMGYEPIAREEFQAEYGIDPLDIKMGSEHWEEWRQFRENLVNSMVQELTGMLHGINPDAIISTSVAPDFPNTPQTHMQNPKNWVQNGYIDLLLPMAYVENPGAIKTICDNSAGLAGEQSFRATGLGEFMKIRDRDLVEQAFVSSQSGAEGTAHFEFEALSLGYGDKLAQGIYRKGAVSPVEHPKESVRVSIADLERKIDTIYVPEKGIQNGQAQKIKAALNQIVKKLNDRPEKIMNKTDKALNKIKTIKHTDPIVQDHLLDDVTYIRNILIHSNNTGLWK